VLYYPERLNGVRSRLRGAVMDVRGDFATARDWWIHPSDRRGTIAPAAGEGAGET
jgi:hypothetical protein